MIKPLRILLAVVLACFACLIIAPKAWAFCGFYVAKADAKLYNQASQVALARNGNKTILTMANDYQGEAKDFAIVVPVPVVLKQEQVRIANPKVIERLDAFSAPRLVEYFDPDPCPPPYEEGMLYERTVPMPAAAPAQSSKVSNEALGVTIEEQFTVGEYDILILSAKESDGLETWLVQNGYKIPQGARNLLKPYIRQKLKFFVAKVNLKEFDKAGFQKLRPIQISYESPRFMLPIRLGMVNAQNAQDLLVYVLSANGQAEVTNYRTVKVPTDAEIPVFVKDTFSYFYKDMFQTAYTQEGKNVAFLEYFWNMANCDPCSADPLNSEELREAGVFWLDYPQPLRGNSSSPFPVVTPPTPVPDPAPGAPSVSRPAPMPIAPPRPPFPVSSNVYITRLHVRYTRDKFPEDLTFQETNNQASFQGRYILRHPFTGKAECPAGRDYVRSLPRRFEQEAQTLARLTGWNLQDIRRKLPRVPVASSLWEQLWGTVSRLWS
ncbi:MAG TPA: DUF2330 domain-containing protein [Microcoleaceae cyanobacterium]|jgi:hypothetical protein